MRLQDQVILITGSTTGIGEHMARRFVKEGARVILHGRDAARGEALRKELVAHVRKEIGPIASPDLIQFSPGLPKTRSGKIMRRILRKVAANELDSLGDTTTLTDPTVVQELIAHRHQP